MAELEGENEVEGKAVAVAERRRWSEFGVLSGCGFSWGKVGEVAAIQVVVTPFVGLGLFHTLSPVFLVATAVAGTAARLGLSVVWRKVTGNRWL